MTQFDPETTALVVVDMQRDFCRPEGALYAPGSETAVEPCARLANVCVLHTAASTGLRDYRVVLVEDAIGALEEGHREYAADHIEWLVGERTTTEGVGFA